MSRNGSAPRVVAVIPARGGSVGVPGKNLRPIGGRSLVARAVDACVGAELIDQVVISSDAADILEEGQRHGARAVRRPSEISGSTASSESAVLHALDILEAEDGSAPEAVLLVQCTSPFMRSADLDLAVRNVLDDKADCAFAVANNHAFLWKYGTADDGTVVGVNHDEKQPRKRRQELPPEFRETGAFYVMRTAGLRSAGRRFFGRIMPQLTPDEYAIEIDSFDDLVQAQMLSEVLATRDDSLPVVDVDAIVTDFDGVHTDDRLYLDQNGVESVQVSREDGMGVALARKAGVRMLILSTEVNPVVGARGRKLQIDVVQGQSDKAQALKQWIADEGLDPARVAYLGNDVNDLGCLRMVGWPVVVANAHPEVKAVARLELARRGGEGAVRELCELVVRAVASRADVVAAEASLKNA